MAIGAVLLCISCAVPHFGVCNVLWTLPMKRVDVAMHHQKNSTALHALPHRILVGSSAVSTIAGRQDLVQAAAVLLRSLVAEP